jgi:hypothetical protein
MRHLNQKGYSILHTNSKAIIRHIATNQICGISELKEDDEYYMLITLSSPPQVASITVPLSIDIIHQRLVKCRGLGTLKSIIKGFSGVRVRV